jgi:hypothetical protein
VCVPNHTLVPGFALQHTEKRDLNTNRFFFKTLPKGEGGSEEVYCSYYKFTMG